MRKNPEKILPQRKVAITSNLITVIGLVFQICTIICVKIFEQYTLTAIQIIIVQGSMILGVSATFVGMVMFLICFSHSSQRIDLHEDGLVGWYKSSAFFFSPCTCKYSEIEKAECENDDIILYKKGGTSFRFTKMQNAEEAVRTIMARTVLTQYHNE